MTLTSPHQRIVHSSQGELTIDANGVVLTTTCEGLTHIQQFDLQEWVDYHIGHGAKYNLVPIPVELDILDLGFWYNKDGKRLYEAPVKNWRSRV